MSERIVWVAKAPTLAAAVAEADDVNNNAQLFGQAVTSTTKAAAATILGAHYLLVKGPEYNISNAIDEAPSDWRSIYADARDGDDAGADTWIPDWTIAAYLLGTMG